MDERYTVTVVDAPDDGIEICGLLQVAADVLGVDICWYYCGDFHFRLSGDWTVSITPESAGRVCVESWSSLRLRDRKWSRSGDCNRVAALVRSALEAALDPA